MVAHATPVESEPATLTPEEEALLDDEGITAFAYTPDDRAPFIVNDEQYESLESEPPTPALVALLKEYRPLR